jgi:hypothetical protein
MKTAFFPKPVKHFICEVCGHCSESSTRVQLCETRHKQAQCQHEQEYFGPTFSDTSLISVECRCSACELLLGTEHVVDDELRWLYELLRERRLR